MEPGNRPSITGALSQEIGDGTCKAEKEKRSLSKRILPELLVSVVYLQVTLFLTWPVVIKISSVVYGKPNDNLGSLWFGWWLRNAGSLGFKTSSCPFVGFPFGTRNSVVPLDFIGGLIDRFLLLFTNEVVVLNINILLSFFLSAITMYFLVRYLVRDRRVAFFAGLAYLICIYHTVTAMIWPALAITQWMPLYILVLLLFMKKLTWKTVVGLAFVEILVAGTSIHYGFFMFVFTAVFLPCYYLHEAWERKSLSGALAESAPRRFEVSTVFVILLALAIIVVALFPVLMLNSGTTQRTKWRTIPAGASIRDTEFAQQTAARPIHYVSPRVPNTYMERAIEPLLGKSSSKINLWVGPEAMRSIYIGWTIIILAALAMLFKDKHKGFPRLERGKIVSCGAMPKTEIVQKGAPYCLRTRSLIWGFFAGAVACFVLSLPPQLRLGSVTIPLPGMLMRIFVPSFRFTYRIGVVVTICSIVLASCGLSWILEKLWKRALVVLAIPIILLSMEMLVVPPFRYFEVNNKPPLYRTLESLPSDSALALYPMNDPGGDSRYLFAQRWFKKPMLNGGPDGSDSEALRRTVHNPFVQQTPSILKRFGISYMVYYPKLFQERSVQPGSVRMTDHGTAYLPTGIELIKRTQSSDALGDAVIYRIDTAPAEFVPLYLGDFTAPQLEQGRNTARLSSGKGLIKILNYLGKDTRVTLRIPMTNFFYPHQIKIVANSKIIWTGEMSGTQKTVLELHDVFVPKEGLDVQLVTAGQKVQLIAEERALLGISQASIKISDVEIIPNE